MTDTTQLKALRDAARDSNLSSLMEAQDLATICDRAIASLEAAEHPPAEQAQQPTAADVPPMPKAWPYNGGQWCKADAVRVLHAACVRIAAEQPKPCAGFVSRDWMTDEDEPTCARPYCGKPKGAHQQPASDVPECPFRPLQLVPVTDRSVADLIAWGTATRAACVRIAQERDEARRELEAVKAFHADVILRYGPFDKDIEALAKRLYIESSQQRARADKAEAEVLTLKGQEPVGEVVDIGDADGDFTCAALKSPMPSLGALLYAAPVATIPLAQHEAALAEARREALREALALVERDAKRMHQWPSLANALITAADGIRALAEKGGEVGKP